MTENIHHGPVLISKRRGGIFPPKRSESEHFQPPGQARPPWRTALELGGAKAKMPGMKPGATKGSRSKTVSGGAARAGDCGLLAAAHHLEREDGGMRDASAGAGYRDRVRPGGGASGDGQVHVGRTRTRCRDRGLHEG